MGQRLDINKILQGWQGASSIIRVHEDIEPEDGMRLVQAIGERLCDGFRIDARNIFVYRNLVLWMLAHPDAKAHDASGKVVPAHPAKGIYIAGPTGTGKSLCMKVFSSFAKALGIQYEVGGKMLYMDFAFYRSDLICDDYAKEGDLQKYKQMPILCIEDLGSENPETLYMGNRRNVIQGILEARGDRALQLTCATSNIPIDRLGDVYGDRVQSRAAAMFNYYILGGGDRRE